MLEQFDALTLKDRVKEALREYLSEELAERVRVSLQGKNEHETLVRIHQRGPVLDLLAVNDFISYFQ
jgi:hypothetical protein